MDEKDDDISIDFGRIKNFFKGKEEKKAEVPVIKEDNDVKSEAKEDDEISLDFSRIKNFFKGKEENKKISFSDSKEEEVNINWSKVIGFFKTYGVIFLVLIPIILSIYIRMQTANLAFADQWAADNVISHINSQVREKVYQNCPNCPELTINSNVDKEMQKIFTANQKQIDENIKGTSDYIKSFFQDEKGNNYMPDIDPYFWVRYAQNIADHGYPGDIIKDGKRYDMHQLAPFGRPVAANMFHPFALAYFYKIIHFFMSGLSLMRTSFYLPVFLSALCVLLVFLIGRKISGNLGGFFAGMIMAVNIAFLSRTLFGHADDDGWVIFFPLLVTWLFIISIDVKRVIKIIILSLLAGFFTGMFAFEWSGWWYIFDFLIATMGVTLAYLLIVNFSEIRKGMKFLFSNVAIRDILIFAAIYIISSAIFVTWFSSWAVFQNSVLGPLGFSSIKDPVQVLSIWPNVLTTVAELNDGSINGVINSVGGPFLFFISLCGLILAISRKEGLKKFDFFYIIGTIAFYGMYIIIKRQSEIHGWAVHNSVNALLVWILLPVALRIFISLYKKDSSYDFKIPILLCLWFISTIFASIKGIRFTLLLAPAFSVAFGVALGKGYFYLSQILTKEFKVHKIVAGSIIILLLLAVYVSPTRGAIGESRRDIPLINDAWYNDLKNIQKGSKPDAIITSWWDFGHHFTSIADRKVTFDGTTQTFPPAHWVGKLLMTTDEKQAIGILRMLDCGQNNAFETMYKINNNSHLSIKIVNEIILLDKEDARKNLESYKFTQEQIGKILSYSHCTPPEGFVIASSDMSTSSRDMDGGKSGVWGHFGSWNFERADLWKNTRNLPEDKAVRYMEDKFNYTKEKAENIYSEIQSISSDNQANAWVASWPGFAGTIVCSKSNENLYECPRISIGKDNNGNNIYLSFKINPDNYDIYDSVQQNTVRPSAAAFVTEDGIFRKEYNGTTIGYGMTVIPRGENDVEVVLSSKELAGSMFVRMYKTKGHGLRYFKLFDEQHGLTGTNIYTYKADWEGKNVTIIDAFVKKPKANESVNLANSTNNTNSS